MTPRPDALIQAQARAAEAEYAFRESYDGRLLTVLEEIRDILLRAFPDPEQVRQELRAGRIPG